MTRLKRRLCGERASVMLEFAFVAPLVLVVAVFAADITRILRTEQQLEIAARLVADVECHMAKFSDTKECPGSCAKRIGKYYLCDVAKVAEKTEDVYVKGSYATVKNPISVAVAAVKTFFDGKAMSDAAQSGGAMFVNILGKILGGIVNFLTFRTDKYILDVIPHDKEIRISVASYIPTVLPGAAYSSLGMPSAREVGKIGVAQMTPDVTGGKAAVGWKLKIDKKNRHRVYCYMPVMDSVPMAPVTYVRKFKQWCSTKPILKGLVK